MKIIYCFILKVNQRDGSIKPRQGQVWFHQFIIIDNQLSLINVTLQYSIILLYNILNYVSKYITQNVFRLLFVIWITMDYQLNYEVVFECIFFQKIFCIHRLDFWCRSNSYCSVFWVSIKRIKCSSSR